MQAPADVFLFAAGSLRDALSELAAVFERDTGLAVKPRYGASGLLLSEIAGGAKAGLFASANMEHPASLHRQNKSGPVRMFARNRLCALVRPGLDVTSDTLLDAMLDPALKVGTSTPKSDPSGDYAFTSFDRAEKRRRGAADVLKKKALQLTGGADSPPPPTGRSVYGLLVAEGEADIFLTYCTNAMAAQRENAALQIVALPDALAVGADYGLTVLDGASDGANRLADCILSATGQAVLVRHGFAPPDREVR